MILYNECGEKVKFQTNEKIGGELSGNVYKISEDECLKVYKKNQITNKDILVFIKNLCLRNFYQIHDFYNDKNGIFKAYTMTYYQDTGIDILTIPTEYTLDNLFKIQRSINILTENNVQIEDTHTGNIVMDSNNITIIDIDLYTFSRFYSDITLKLKNIEKLEYLFREIYIEALSKHHSEYNNYETRELIRNTFKLFTLHDRENIFNELSKYRYPIDYIKKKINKR